MWTAGDSVQAIARNLGRTAKAVEEKRKREALPTRDPGLPWDEESDAVLRRMWTAGAGAKQIAHVLDRSENAVKARRFTLALPPRKIVIDSSRAWTDQDKATLGRLWIAGYSVAYIAKRMGRTEGAVLVRRLILKLPRREAGYGTRRRHLVGWTG